MSRTNIVGYLVLIFHPEKIDLSRHYIVRPVSDVTDVNTIEL